MKDKIIDSDEFKRWVSQLPVKTLRKEELIAWIEEQELPILLKASMIDENTIVLEKIIK